jgi:hypothetical protein
MVTISDYSKRVNSDGEEFFALILQDDLELVKSHQTGWSLNRMGLKDIFYDVNNFQFQHMEQASQLQHAH